MKRKNCGLLATWQVADSAGQESRQVLKEVTPATQQKKAPAHKWKRMSSQDLDFIFQSSFDISYPRITMTTQLLGLGHVILQKMP